MRLSSLGIPGTLFHFETNFYAIRSRGEGFKQNWGGVGKTA